MKKKIIHNLMVTMIWVGIWVIFDLILSDDTHFAGPLDTAKRLLSDVQTKEFWKSIITTYSGIVLGFLLALFVGTILGYLAHYFKAVEAIISPLIVFFSYIPMISFTLLAILWSSNSLLVFEVSLFLSIPVIYKHTVVALNHVGGRLLAEVWRPDVNIFLKIDHMYRPATMPEYMVGCHRAINMCCKSGILAQFLGKAPHSVAKSLSEAAANFDVAGIFSWTIVIVIISVGLERLVIRILSLSFINEQKIDVEKVREAINEEEDMVL